ncbi:MAG: TrbC/VirB2 family protein [Chloroflexi bacterium]|nr:TrbC/VirB2 family protein [Chloroflexota bacterium]MYF39034.1 TrbC/VirB2 family protein [Gammaproteobacteria bacterium]
MREQERWLWSAALTLCLVVAYQELLLAQGASPWVQAVNNVRQAFTGPIARGLALVAIVVGGILFMFNEGGAKQTLAGIIFGVGMAMGAVNFLNWIL